MFRRTEITVLFLLAVVCANAQGFRDKLVSAFADSPDSTYIDDLRGYFGTQLSVFVKNSSFSVDDLGNLSSLQYNCADSSGSVSCGISYKWLSFRLGCSMGLFNPNRIGRKYDISTQMYFPAVTLKFTGNVYQGYCLRNTRTLMPQWTDSSLYERPDIKTNALRVSADYYFNYREYSRKALTSQGELQKKSAGSFLVGTMLNRNVVKADSSLIPSMVSDTLFGYRTPMSGVRNLLVGIDFGYARTFVMPSKWFINGQFAVGFAYNNCVMRLSNAPDRLYNTMNMYFQGDIYCGYNSRRLFFNTSFSLLAIESTIGKEGVNINNVNYMVQATVAYRFKPEKDYSVGEFFREKWHNWRNGKDDN